MTKLLDKNILTIAAVGLLALVVLIAVVAAITGNYDSESVRALVDDLKYIAAALTAAVALARGIKAAGEAKAHINTDDLSKLSPDQIAFLRSQFGQRQVDTTVRRVGEGQEFQR